MVKPANNWAKLPQDEMMKVLADKAVENDLYRA